MQDIIFSTDEFVFSYRVAGICVKNGKVLLQKPTNDTGYAFPGGHVTLGETNEQTLIREFEEEMGARIEVGELRWLGELFFPWGDKPCHQICLYYTVELQDNLIPTDGFFVGHEKLQGRNYDLEFHWIDIEKLKDMEVYPTQAHELMHSTGVQHFLYREG
jgi:8-oxo-dGTP pyrophosphatase MutT (NUDIX family)